MKTQRLQHVATSSLGEPTESFIKDKYSSGEGLSFQMNALCKRSEI